MKRISACLLVLFVVSISPVVFAGPGSDHTHEPAAPISEDEALKTAAGIVANNVKKGKLPESWGTVKPKKSDTENLQKRPGMGGYL